MIKWSGMVKTIIRFFSCIISSVVVTSTVRYILSELQVFWYMRVYHIAYRADLANDYGFALLGLLLIPTFIIWKLLKKYYR